MKIRPLACLLLSLLAGHHGYTEPSQGPGLTDWPHWRGIGWDGKSTEMQWSPSLMKSESVAWTAEVGPGYSSVAVVDGLLYTLGGRSGAETAYCINAATGKAVWSVTLPAIGPRSYNDGPQSTPTIDGRRLYFLTPGGVVFCLGARDGSILWYKDLVTDLGVTRPLWCFSGSVRIRGSMAIVNAGGGGVALNKDTGRVIWANEEGDAGYTTPVIFASEAGECVALSTIGSFVVVRADTGKILWSHPWTGTLHDYQADPLIMGTRAFISSAYQRGAALVDFSGWKSRVLWDTPKLLSNLASYVYFDGLIYGNSNPAYNSGDVDAEFFCMEAATGKKLWSMAQGLGTVISVGRYLIRLGRTGYVSVGLRDPGSFKETSGFKMTGGTFITPPAFSNGRLFCRSASGKLMCVDLGDKRAAKPAPPSAP